MIGFLLNRDMIGLGGQDGEKMAFNFAYCVVCSSSVPFIADVGGSIVGFYDEILTQEVLRKNDAIRKRARGRSFFVSLH